MPFDPSDRGARAEHVAGQVLAETDGVLADRVILVDVVEGYHFLYRDPVELVALVQLFDRLWAHPTMLVLDSVQNREDRTAARLVAAAKVFDLFLQGFGKDAHRSNSPAMMLIVPSAATASAMS